MISASFCTNFALKIGSVSWSELLSEWASIFNNQGKFLVVVS